MTQKDPADALGVTPRSVTTLLDSLESLGLASRSPHPPDRREIMVSLSPIGQSTLEQLQRDMTALAITLFSDMTDAELKDVVGVVAVASEKPISLAVE